MGNFRHPASRLRVLSSSRRLAAGAVAVVLFLVFGSARLRAQLSGVRDADAADAGIIEGTIADATGQPIANASVVVRETGSQVSTNDAGAFRLPAIEPGTYSLVVSAPGYQRTQVTDVVVNPRRVVLLSPVGLQKPLEGVTRLDPYVVKAEPVDITRLEDYTVAGARPQPFTGANVDLARGIDDPQPYYILNSTAIARSGATSVEDFLRRRVPMDLTARANRDIVGVTGTAGSGMQGNASSISLNGFGSGYTLVLVNGRPLPSPALASPTGSVQADLNAIPVAAIERIEVLPASASGVYGSNAVAGVINVVLRHDYVGAQVDVTYENHRHGDAPTRTVSFVAGVPLENGRTHVLITAGHSDSEPLRYRDRLDVLQRYHDIAVARDPNIGGSTQNFPPLGATLNINAAPVTATVNGVTTQVPGALFGPGTSDATYVPAGFSGADPAQTLEILRANAGQHNLAPPSLAQGTSPWFGLDFPLSLATRVDSVYASLRRQFSGTLEMFAEFRYGRNTAASNVVPGMLAQDIPATAPGNIFGTEIRVVGPYAIGDANLENVLINRQWVAGLKLKLPRDWIAEADFNYGEARSRTTGAQVNSILLQAEIASGAFNIFRDLAQFPGDPARYGGNAVYHDTSVLYGTSLRGAGPLVALPGGDVTLIAAGNYQRNAGVQSAHTTVYNTPPLPGTSPVQTTTDPDASQAVASGYAELTVPVVGEHNARPGVARLDVQVAARGDYFDTGGLAYAGQDRRRRSRLFAGSETFGIAYRPTRGVMLRGSVASAFHPPQISQLREMAPPLLGLIEALPDLAAQFPGGYFPQRISDPRRGGESYNAAVATGGYAGLKPETATNVSGGIVLEPRRIPGFRLSLDYSAIRKHDDIRGPSPQDVLAAEAYEPGRVARDAAAPGDPYGVGRVTFIDARSMNLYRSFTSAFNLALQYELATPLGRFDVSGLMTSEQHYAVQTVAQQPEQEQLGNPNAFYLHPKFSGDLTLDWRKGRWSAGWAIRFYGAYRVPATAVVANGGPYVRAQSISDAYIGYRFADLPNARSWRRALSGTAVQLGAKNVLNQAPPFDAGNVSTFYSYYGDIRMASYYLSVTKEF